MCVVSISLIALRYTRVLGVRKIQQRCIYNKERSSPLLCFRLDTLEMSANDFNPATEPRTLRNRLESVSSLLELAAVNIVSRNIRVSPEDVHPALLQYLDSGMRCLCSKPVWTNVAVALVTLDLGKVANQISIGGLDSVCIEAQLCSQKCLQLFMKNPYAF